MENDKAAFQKQVVERVGIAKLSKIKQMFAILGIAFLSAEGFAADIHRDLIFDNEMGLITNPSRGTPVQTPFPNSENPFYLEIKGEPQLDGTYSVTGGGVCNVITGSVNVDILKRQLRDFALTTKRDFDCENTTELTVEDYALEMLKLVRSYEIKQNKVQMKDTRGRTILWFGIKA